MIEVMTISALSAFYFCSGENGRCRCNGTVYYGDWAQQALFSIGNVSFNVDGKRTEKYLNGGEELDIPCNNGFFGDPKPGVVKKCFCAPKGSMFHGNHLKILDPDLNKPEVDESPLKTIKRRPLEKLQDAADVLLGDKIAVDNKIVEKKVKKVCAQEHGVCNCNGKVWYGKGHISNWVVKDNIEGSIGCNNDVFGDPNYGVFKECVCVENADQALSRIKLEENGENKAKRYCAEEGGQCECGGKVWYGAGQPSKWTSKQVSVRVGCNNTEFGDPNVGVHKKCWCQE